MIHYITYQGTYYKIGIDEISKNVIKVKIYNDMNIEKIIYCENVSDEYIIEEIVKHIKSNNSIENIWNGVVKMLGVE